jgi:TonB-linked SusC/RagA family outer membrane protein
MQLLLYCKGRHKRPPLNLKFFLAMKMLSLLLSVACLELGATGYSQEITISLKNASLEKVFKQIENQTTFRFLYSKEAIDQAHPVTIEVKNETLENVLKLCFTNQPISYSIEEKFIIVKIPEEKKKMFDLFHDVRGKVVNENGEPLVGITIKVKGSNKMTMTDANGEFIINDIGPNDILIISGAEMETIEVKVNAKNSFTISLSQKVKELDQTVVIGYGTTTKRHNTGSVSKVTADEIGKQPVSNPLAALQGRVPGLLINQKNGLPGSNFSVILRGRNSIEQNNSPLYIVDGVPFLSDADQLTQRSLINANSPFNTINPLDIESIEVLKDADATAIYGSRGANGVILITTKKGQIGKTTVNINFYSGWGKITRTLNYMNTQQYLAMRREAFNNDGVTPTVGNARDLLRWDTTRYTNWKKFLIGGTARNENAFIRFSGGTKNDNFSLSANYHRETTVFPKELGNKGVSVDFSFIHNSNDNKFSTQIKSSYGSDRSNLMSEDLTGFLNISPNSPKVYDSLGRLNWRENGSSFINPLSVMFRDYNGNTDRLTANGLLSYKLIKGLNFKSSFGFNDIRINETTTTPISSQNPSNLPTGAASFANNRVRTWIVEPQAEFNTIIKKKGRFQILLGSTFQETSNSSDIIDAIGYTNDALLNSTTGAASMTSSVTNSLYRYEAFFGRIHFNWNEKYLINITGRRDGSSRFGPGKQFGNFGAVGFGWIFSNENFIQNKLPFISYGKLRGSCGTVGNEPSSNYQYLDTWSGTSYTYQDLAGLQPTRLYNPDFRWEQVSKIEGAIELGFFKDRVYLSVDWFRSRTGNQLISYSLPGQVGFSSVLKNFPATVQNTGWEIEIINKTVKSKNFKWSNSINITIPQNKLLAFPELNSSSYAKSYILGEPLNIIQGLHFVGLNSQTGVYQFADLNQDGQFNELDYVKVGTTNPLCYGGMISNFDFKGLELYAHITFTKQKGIDPIYRIGSGYGNRANQPVDILKHWQKPGDVAQYEKYSQNFGGDPFIQAYYLSISDATLVDASFIRLRNLSLSYNLPVSWISKAHFKAFKIYIQAQNLFTITSFKTDPETQNQFVLPPLKTFTAGLQMTF